MGQACTRSGPREQPVSPLADTHAVSAASKEDPNDIAFENTDLEVFRTWRRIEGEPTPEDELKMPHRAAFFSVNPNNAPLVTLIDTQQQFGTLCDVATRVSHDAMTDAKSFAEKHTFLYPNAHLIDYRFLWATLVSSPRLRYRFSFIGAFDMRPACDFVTSSNCEECGRVVGILPRDLNIRAHLPKSSGLANHQRIFELTLKNVLFETVTVTHIRVRSPRTEVTSAPAHFLSRTSHGSEALHLVQASYRRLAQLGTTLASGAVCAETDAQVY